MVWHSLSSMVASDRSSWPSWARLLTTGWVLSPLVVIALIAVTVEGYGYYIHHQVTPNARGGQFGASNVAADASHGVGPGSRQPLSQRRASKPGAARRHRVVTLPAVHNDLAVPTAEDRGPSPTSSQSAASHPAAPSWPSHSVSPRSSAPATPSTVVAPRTGQYVLAVKGSETTKLGPISLCTNTFPSRSTLNVHRATGDSPTLYDFDLQMYPGSPNQHDEQQIYRYSQRSVVLTADQETVTCLGLKQSTEVDYSPGQIRVRLPLKVGSTWHNHGGGTARTETGTSRVLRRTSVTIKGTAYPVFEIATKLAVTGSQTGQRDQTWWYSPELAMPLKFSETVNGQRSGATYAESYTASVVSLP
jgi:hypothetical protein